jgi:hypothetical protein
MQETYSVYKVLLYVSIHVFVSLPYSISLMNGHELLKMLKASGQPQCFVPRGASRICIYFWKQATQEESNNVEFFPFALHIAIQEPFKPLWSRLLLHDHEPFGLSFALCFKSLLM